MDETKITDQTNVQKLGPWMQAGVDDGVISELLKKKYLGADYSILFFQMIGFITGIAALFTTLIRGENILLSVAAAIIVMIFLYCIFENQKDRKIRKNNIEKKLYEVCDVEAFDLSNEANRKYCYVKDQNGTVFMQQGKEEKPKKVMYFAYFSGKDYSAKLLKMRYGRKEMLYLVFPVAYLKGLL